MCDVLAHAWVEFAKTGEPDYAGLPTWKKFEVDERATLILGPDTRVVRDPYAQLRLFWLDMPAAASVFG